MLKKKISPQSEPHRAKLCFSMVLKHSWWNSQRTSLFSQKKCLSQKGALKYSDIWFFLTCLKRRKSCKKFGFV